MWPRSLTHFTFHFMLPFFTIFFYSSHSLLAMSSCSVYFTIVSIAVKCVKRILLCENQALLLLLLYSRKSHQSLMPLRTASVQLTLPTIRNFAAIIVIHLIITLECRSLSHLLVKADGFIIAVFAITSLPPSIIYAKIYIRTNMDVCESSFESLFNKIILESRRKNLYTKFIKDC